MKINIPSFGQKNWVPVGDVVRALEKAKSCPNCNADDKGISITALAPKKLQVECAECNHVFSVDV